ncbi:uncharacterized protein TRUGW13939_04862 [Talaromyces rugulosus]|uniref:GPI anchored protein n=1 Tax=Talaromyces rugulosus TaxID=121627 RepID=A0A7H8QUN3_TALRU|nr:uncharacterized protein TRUGW13939_04862 [Talaromyces rugulosus]QKX57742.1 hypothetical protein TRUGW13939_04862 [Talaromyces rugulosus]
MHVSRPLFSGLLLVAVVVASNIDDVPHQCRDICAPVVSLASYCDDRSDRINEDNDDDDDDELSCICNGSDASTSIPMCDVCITEYGNDGSDNDVNDLVQSCSFTTSSYISTSTSTSTATGEITSATTTTSATSATISTSSSSTGQASSSSTSTSASAAATSDSGAAANDNFNSGMFGLIGAGALAIMNL